MAHSVSARKRIRQAAKRRVQNASMRSMFRTRVKQVHAAIEAGDKAAAEKAYQLAVPAIDKVTGKGLVHKNKGARHKRRLNQAIRNMS